MLLGSKVFSAYHSFMTEDIEARLAAIEQRNRNVETDKAWEVSVFRRMSIAGITYVSAYAALVSIGQRDAYLSAVIPVLGYVLSTLSLPIFKSWWLKRRRDR